MWSSYFSWFFSLVLVLHDYVVDGYCFVAAIVPSDVGYRAYRLVFGLHRLPEEFLFVGIFICPLAFFVYYRMAGDGPAQYSGPPMIAPDDAMGQVLLAIHHELRIANDQSRCAIDHQRSTEDALYAFMNQLLKMIQENSVLSKVKEEEPSSPILSPFDENSLTPSPNLSSPVLKPAEPKSKPKPETPKSELPKPPPETLEFKPPTQSVQSPYKRYAGASVRVRTVLAKDDIKNLWVLLPPYTDRHPSYAKPAASLKRQKKQE